MVLYFSFLMADITLEQLLLLAKLHPDASIQEIANQKIREMTTTLLLEEIKKYPETGDSHAYYPVLNLATNSGIPLDIRVQAGNYILSTNVKKGRVSVVESIIQNALFPEEVRDFAAKQIIPVYTNFINRLNETVIGNELERYIKFEKIAKDTSLPQEVNSLAKKKMTFVLTTIINMEAENDYVYEKWEHIAKDVFLSYEFRVKAGNRIVEAFVREGDYKLLTQLINDNQYPSETQEKAMNEIASARMTAFRKYKEKKYDTSLREVAQDQNFPLNIRVIAGILAVDLFAEAHRGYDQITRMEIDQLLPQPVRVYAQNSIKKIVASLGVLLEANK